MKHLTLVLPKEENILSTITCILGAYEIFELANVYWENTGRDALFTIQLAGLSEKEELKNGLLTIKPEIHITDLKKTDLIIIPSLSRKYMEDFGKNKQFCDWLTMQYKSGAEIASLCSGAFMLAASGLLDGKSCSTRARPSASWRTRRNSAPPPRPAKSWDRPPRWRR